MTDTMHKVTIEVPATFTLSIGGLDHTFRAKDIAQESWDHAAWTGLCRVASYTYTSAKAAAITDPETKKKDELRWTARDHDKMVDEVKTRLYDGDWSRRAAKPSDPIGDHAIKLTKEKVALRLAGKVGIDVTSGVPRMSTIRDQSKGDKTVAKMLAKYGEFGGKSGNMYTWNPDAIADYIKANDMRDVARDDLARLAALAASAESDGEEEDDLSDL